MAKVAVWFNDDEQRLFQDSLSSKKFSRFVKDAFYDKIDEMRLKAGVVAIDGQGPDQG